MKQSEKMLIFALATLFHAARIAGATARGESDFPSRGNSLAEAHDFYEAAQASGIVPDLPDDDKR